MEEETINRYWQDNKIFEESLIQNSDKNTYVYFDGPPFMSGLPHYGHLLAGYIKDSVLRYNYANGMNVPRIAGVDAHGLPIEYEIEKELGIKMKQEIENMGIMNYNNECRKIIFKYLDEWKRQTLRIGRWIDYDNRYATIDKNFMNSVWWVFKKLYEDNKIYCGVEVMGYPYRRRR